MAELVWCICSEADYHIKKLEARITKLEAALRHLDDLIVDLDAGYMELPQVSKFINTTLDGGKDE